MAVVDVTQMWSRDGGTASADPNDLRFVTLQRTRGFQVLTDDTETALYDVENADGVPRRGDLYPGASEARCVSLKTTKVGPIFWMVEATYEGDNSFSFNPPVIKKSSVTSSEPIDQDWNGFAIVNTIGEAVEGLSRDVSDTIITVTRNFETINDDLVLDYLEATNSDTWYGYTPGRVRLISYQADQLFKNELWVGGYWRVTATLQCRRGYGDTTPDKAWYKRFRNEGLYEKVTILGEEKIIRAVDQAGSPVTKPVLLKEDGTREDDPEAAFFNHAQVYGSLPYNALGLL